MALTNEKISAMIDALEEAMASGATSISIDGRTVNYKSVQEIIAALDYFRGRLNGGGSRPPIRRINLG